MEIFEKLKISNFFREKSKMLKFSRKSEKTFFFQKFPTFRFFAKNVQKFSDFQKFPKKNRKINVKNIFEVDFQNFWCFEKLMTSTSQKTQREAKIDGQI